MSLLVQMQWSQYQLYMLHRMLASEAIVALAEYCHCSITEAWQMHMDGIRLG